MLGQLLQPPAIRTGLVTPRDVGGTIAWRSLHLDGHLVHLWGENSLPAEEDPDPTHRALALTQEVVARTVLGRQSAVWVFTGESMSPLVHLIYDPKHHRPPPKSGRATHQAHLLAEDVIELSGVPVTSPVRTAMDCAMFLPRAQAVRAVRELGPLVTRAQVRNRIQRAPQRTAKEEPMDVVDRALA